MEKTSKENNAHVRCDIDGEIKRIRESGGYTTEERISLCWKIIDMCLARSEHIVQTGLQTGALTWPSMAERVLSVLKSIECGPGVSSAAARYEIVFKQLPDSSYTIDTGESADS